MNIVIKLLAVKITESWPFYFETCKLSEDQGKYSGNPATVRRFMEASTCGSRIFIAWAAESVGKTLSGRLS